MQCDNGSFTAKARQRIAVVATLPPTARVLEAFAGEGRMWAAAWAGFAGACIDKNERKARDAAAARPGWACYQGDTERAILAGWMGHLASDVVDIDAYGSPWPFLLAWCRSERKRAPVTHLFLTDGYMEQAGLAPRCRALFGDDRGKRGDMPAEVYLETVRSRLAGWCALFGGEARDLRTDPGAQARNGKRMRLHYARVLIP